MPPTKLRKSIATVSVSGSLPEKLKAVAAAGFDGVEIFDNDLVACPLSPEDVRKLAADLGLGIDLYQPLRDIEAAPPGRFADNLRRAEHKFRTMERLGATTLLVCSSVAPDTIDDDELAASQLGRLAELAAGYGIRIAYEALAWGRYVHDYLHAWRIVRLADHPNLGTCLDSFHILSRGSEPVGIEAIPGEKIFYLQLADAPRLAMDVLQWSRHYRCFPGQGDFDVAGLAAHALRAGYAGPLSLEVFNDEFRQGRAASTAVDALRSLIALEEDIRRLMHERPVDASGAGSGPVEVAGLSVPTGFAFAELAAGAGSEATANLLTALGFTRAADASQSGAAHCWEQGRARILVTGAERGDTELTAFGVESADPTASSDRARTLLAPVGDCDNKDGSPCVVTPDGTRLYFREATPARGGNGSDGLHIESSELTHIDHIALAQPRHRFDAAALFYRSVLGLSPQQSVEFADPFGLVRSRAMANHDDSVRIALNLAQTDEPDAAPGRRASQHIAFASRDIVATARRLRGRSGVLLPIPDNYYDDLEARYDLGAERHRTLRELGLLFDRDEHGEFLHLYTVTVDRVFFEIVQRFGGYRGYGMQNSAIRLAAQHSP